MAKEKFQVEMVGSEDTPDEKIRGIFSEVLDVLLKRKPSGQESSELQDKN